MSAHVGITEMFGTDTPSGCLAQQVSKEQSAVDKSIRDETGVTVQMTSLTMVTVKTTISVVGIPDLSLVAENRDISAESLVITDVSASENNDDFPKGTVTYTSWTNDG